MNKLLIGAISAVAFAAASSSAYAEQAKYVFMMIGDGMATTQRNAAAMYLEATQGQGSGSQVGIVRLTMDGFPAQGMSTTYSTNSLITDSAAAGTALATGKKTKSGVINMDPEGKTKYIPLTKPAHDKGYKIGIVTSVSIDHATPAAYYAHAAGRSDYYDIAMQMLDSGFEYFAGGAVLQPNGKDKDKQSFYDVAKSKGYAVTQTRADFEALKPGQRKVFAENPVRADENALPYALDARKGDLSQRSLSLAELTQKGIDLLKGDKFFMMVEGGKIDWAGHANDPGANIHDTLAFDDAVKVAYDFYRQHPKETLIIVTGDHETGGLSLGFAGTDYSLAIKEVAKQKGTYIAFTDAFEAMIEKNAALTFEDVLPLIESTYGLSLATLKPFEIESAKAAFARSLLPADQRKAEKGSQDYLLYGSYNPLSMTVNHIASHRAGLGWATYAHTGVPVPVSAVGVGAEGFNGFYDNTDIGKKTMALMGL